MIRSKSLLSSIKASILTNKTTFPHKIQQSWDSQFNEQNPKLNYLQKLLQSNSIRPYFIEKDIKQLQKQDIYFFMQNKQLFYKLPRQSKEQLIKNPNASAVLKFHLAQQIKALKNQQVQKHLLQSFNKQLLNLNINDVLFCLDIIVRFEDVDDKINFYELQRKAIQEQDPEVFIRLVYYLSELNYQLEMIDTQIIHERISTLQEVKFQDILHIKRLAANYKIELSPYNQDKLRKSFMNKRQKFTEEEGENLVLLLQYYPESANFINIECLNTEAYISYLEFFNVEEGGQMKQKEIPKIIHHSIPLPVIQKAQTYQFSQIIQNRFKLGIQSLDSLIQNIRDYYTSQLNCFMAMIRFFEKEKKLTPEIQSILEKSLMKEIVNSGQRAWESYNIVDVFKVLGYLSVNNLGTIIFWKKTLKFVTASIQDSNNYKDLSGDEQKKFVVYLFQIFKNKPFPIQLQDQIINLTLLSLTINRWSIREILPLTISLKVNKIADNELWFGIEQRLNQINFRHLESESDKKVLKKIIYNFNSIGKGSYEYWNEMNRILNKKEKLEILSHFRIPSTLAHTYLKV